MLSATCPPHSPLFLSPPPPRAKANASSVLSFPACRLGLVQNWKSRKERFRSNSTNHQKRENEGIPLDINSVGSSQSTTSFLSVLCPLLKLFSGGDPSRERNYILEEVTSSLSTLVRFPWGSRSLAISTVDPSKNLQLFEFEACPFCRRVREAITELDLSVENLDRFCLHFPLENLIYPCPKGSKRHREIVRGLGGKEQFPYLVDLNTGVSMYESGEIVKYLFQQYGKGRTPSFGLLESTPLTGWMPTILRAGRGMTLWERARLDPPFEKLELFSFENNPNSRIVREALCELELPYIHRTVGERSRRLNSLFQASGSNKVPYIIDPNTGTQVGDYRKILSYLFQTYSIDAA